MKPFDQQFADNVRETFDNWREQVPKEAWAKMGSKLDNAKQPKVIPFWKKPSRVAAIALLTAASVALLVLPILLQKDNNDSELSQPIAETNQSEFDVFPSPVYQEGTVVKEPIITVIEKKKKGSAEKRSGQRPVFAELNLDELTPELTTDLVVNEAPFQKPIIPVEEMATAILDEGSLPLQETGKMYDDNDLPLIAHGANEPELDFFFHDKPSTSRFSWAVSASPMFSFAHNQSNPTPGLAAGITAGYDLTPRLRIEVGSLLAYNHLDIKNEATFSFVESFSDLYASQDASAPTLVFSGNNKYNLLALEIPANIQFNVFDGASRRFFVSTGLSSMFYLHQTVSGVNHVFVQNDMTGMPSGSEAYSSTTVFVDDSFGLFSRIDLGRILNLSAGYVIVGKNNSIVLEPFLKLPLGNISSSNLRPGVGGLNLKILFSGK